MQRVFALLVAFAIVGAPVWATANAAAPMASRSSGTAIANSEMMAFQGAAARYNPATRILTLTNGTKLLVAPDLSIEALSVGAPFDGTYQIKDGKKVLEAYWIDVGQARGATL